MPNRNDRPDLIGDRAPKIGSAILSGDESEPQRVATCIYGAVLVLTMVMLFISGGFQALLVMLFMLVAAAIVLGLCVALVTGFVFSLELLETVIVAHAETGRHARGRSLFATVDDREEWVSMVYDVRSLDASSAFRSRELAHLALLYVPAVVRSHVDQIRRKIRQFG